MGIRAERKARRIAREQRIRAVVFDVSRETTNDCVARLASPEQFLKEVSIRLEARLQVEGVDLRNLSDQGLVIRFVREYFKEKKK